MKRTILRYQDSTRINHWAVALLFVCAGLSGLALFHPSLFFFSNLFGGGPWTRILHPYFGLLMVLGFVLLFLQVWRENLWTKNDSAWLKNANKMLQGDDTHLPPVGKYNAGQKLVVWTFVVSLLVLLLTGLLFWRPWFDGLVPIVVQRIAVLLHAVAACALILSVIIHVYAAIWVKGSISAMTRGRVSASWAQRHHPLWYEEMNGEK